MKIIQETFKIKGASLNGLNPLPKLRDHKKPNVKTDAEFPQELKKGIGCQAKVLPYLMQDRYTQERKTLTLKSFVLENQYLHARFLPEYGGRLHALYDKIEKRDLLFANPVIQPGNLAIRNAWLSGGIEWNIGCIGHTYTTCDNVYTAILDDGNGNDFLRIYEFERNKSIFWQVDFHLPDNSRYLISHVRMINPFDTDTTTYWWSNIAVPTDTKTRILASNRHVISFVDGACKFERLPHLTAFPDADVTFPENAPRAFDYFIQKDNDGESTWEAAAYEDGLTFYERSTAPLYYKKLFAWGNHRAGKHWQEFLSDGVGTGYYAEIQAGIAPSQLHDKELPAHSSYEWTQCFGRTRLDSNRLFGDYDEAVDYLGATIDHELSKEAIELLDQTCRTLADVKVQKTDLVHYGSGFGALEIRRMKKDGDATPPASMCFPEELMTEVEQPWLTLLETGTLPDASPDWIPTSYMISEKWLPRLKACAEQSGSWNALLHYGTAVYEYQNNRVYVTDSYNEEQEAQQLAEAKRAWEASVEKTPNAWSLRNLAILAERENAMEQAEALYDRALALPEAFCDYALASEYLGFLTRLKKYEKVWKIFNALPEDYQMVDRIQISAAVAAVRIGEFDYLEGFFKRKHHDVREGEESLTNVWFEYSAHMLARQRGIENPTPEQLNELIDEAWDLCPPDYSIDFRMSVNKKQKYRV